MEQCNKYMPTKWATAGDKLAFEKQFKNFVRKGCPYKLFYKTFYNQIMQMRGHIAHYNRDGFYDEQLSTHEKRAEFLQHWTTAPIYGEPTYTWCDVERVLANWLLDNLQYERDAQLAHNAEVEQSERTEYARLQHKYGT